jgi:hypothetical protein
MTAEKRPLAEPLSFGSKVAKKSLRAAIQSCPASLPRCRAGGRLAAMDLLSDPVRRFAEEPDQFLPDQALPLRRVRAPSFVLTLWPTQASISEIRSTDDELDETIEQARRLVTENGHARATWTVGPSCRPVGLAT